MNAYSCISTLNVTVLDCPILEVASIQSGIHPPSACGAQDGGFSFGQGVAATGGAPPYSFILTDYNGNTLPIEDYGGWENLGAGYYSLAIIDNNGCRGEVPFTIEGEDVEISYGTSPECEHRSNGTIWLQAYVPAPGHNGDSFHYAWSTGDEFDSSEGILLEGLAAGQYTVTVTGEDGNCSYTETIEVEGFASEAPLSVEAEVVNSCPQYPSGRIELQVTGGVPYPNVIGFPHIPYMVRWQGNHSSHFELAYNLGAGDYPVTVTDFCGNTVTGTFTVGAFPDYAIELEDIDHLCPGETSGAVDISLAGGDGPFAVYWYNEGENYPPISTGEDLAGVPGGAYRVKAYDSHGCKREKPFAILASSLDQIQSTVKGSCEELSPGIGSISLSVNTPFPVTSILWDHENQTSSSISELDPGFYQVTITDTECTYELEYEVTQYTYSESPDPPGSCWDRITCGPNLNQRIWTGILNTEFKSEAGACYVRALCGNGESWNPPNSSDLYWDNYDGRVINDAADIIECWKDQICEIDWTYTDPFGITYYVFNPPEIVRSRVSFGVTRKDKGRWQPECNGSEKLIEWWCGYELVDTDCEDAPEPLLLFPGIEPDQAIVSLLVYPNPSSRTLNIDFNLAQDGVIRFVLYNSMAEKLLVQEQYFHNGPNNYSLQNWGDKPSGVYILELSTGKEILGKSKILKY